MDNDKIVEELSIFGLTFENDNVVNALNLFMKRHHRDALDTLDALVAYATNHKRTTLTQSFINEFVEYETSNAEQRQENIPPTKMEIFSPVKKEPTFDVDDDFVSKTDVTPFKVTQTVKGAVNAKLILDETIKEVQFSLLPYSFTSNDDTEDNALEILSAGEDITVSGCVFVPKRNNEVEKVRILSKKYGNLEVDLAKVSHEFIFDKMFATFDANFEGNILKVRNIVPPVPPKCAEIVRTSFKMLEDFASIMVACGPFNDEGSFVRMFNHAKENSVKLLIIFGPLPCIIKSQLDTVEKALDSLLYKICELAKGDMDVVIVPPCENDPFILYPTYPTTAYHSEYFTPEKLQSKKVHLLDNPAVFSFDGMQIAAANFDTMKALSKGALITSAELPTSDRMIWYVQQMLQHGQVCPSYSCPSTLKNNKFIKNPTIFISPSKLRSFAAGIENVFYVNLCSNRGNGYSIIKPKITETNGEDAKLEFDTSFYV